MKNRLVLLVLLVAVFLIFLFFYNRYRTAPQVDLFNLSLVSTEGNPQTLSSFQGKNVMIVFYASWCPDCRVELDALNEIYASRLQNVEVICITDDPIEKMNSFKQKKKYPFHFFRTTTELSALGIFTIPANYLVNSNGEIVFQKVGAIDWNDNSILVKTLELFK
jgi:peroxiredoxin